MYLLKLKEEEKIEKLSLELKQFFEMIVAENLKLDGMQWKRELRILITGKINQIRENQPDYEIKIATEEMKTEVKYFVERLPNAANARNICRPLSPRN